MEYGLRLIVFNFVDGKSQSSGWLRMFHSGDTERRLLPKGLNLSTQKSSSHNTCSGRGLHHPTASASASAPSGLFQNLSFVLELAAVSKLSFIFMEET